MVYKISHLKFHFRKFLSMSHTYDVINRRSKIGTQKQQGTIISWLDVVHLDSNVLKLFLMRNLKLKCEILYAICESIIYFIVLISWAFTKITKFGPENRDGILKSLRVKN